MIQSLKGFNDILQFETSSSRPTNEWRQLEAIVIDIIDRYGYEQVRLPIVEQMQLFARSIGEATDIIEKEMFNFTDKSEPPTPIALRPEGTAGVVRAIIEHNMLRGDAPKLWYMGPMFRYEQPQKGRYRQFQQLGVEVFGCDSADIEAELIALTAMMWEALDIDHELSLQINSLGEVEERLAYRQALVSYLTDKHDGLDEDSQRRLSSNPLRILDSKDPSTQAILKQAPTLNEFLGEASRTHFNQLQSYLKVLGIKFEINLKLVRGLDYYNKTVFEWVTDKLGAQATVCAGGRYDGLIGQLKSTGTNKSSTAAIKAHPAKSAPAIGFAIGMERLLLLKHSIAPFNTKASCDVFIVAHPDVYSEGLNYGVNLRRKRPDLRVKSASATSLKAQMKKADKSGAKLTVILAQNEVDTQQISIKSMHTGNQTIHPKEWLFDPSNFTL